MDFGGLVFLGGILSYVGVIVYLANQIDAAQHIQTTSVYDASPDQPAVTSGGGLPRETLLRWLLYGLIIMMFVLGLAVLQTAFFQGAAVELQQEQPEAALPPISMTDGIALFAVALIASYASLRLITSDTSREWLQRLLHRWGGRFNPASQVHLAAAVLMLAVAVYVLANFVLQGGVEGVAAGIEENGVQAGDVIFQAVLEVVITFLGVGLAIRRGWPETLQRLGLRVPTREDVLWGFGMGLGFLVFMIVFNLVWAAVTSPELLEQQTSAAQNLNMAFSTIPLAFVLASSAAFGEEIWIRGGLQPVFGIGVSSVFFAILHIQVAFTPGTLLILVVSLGLGWLRQRHSTVAAIVAHFCFNFVQLAILALAVEAV
jgi:membrane protease YdiL (CAAX protease family)